MIDLLYLVGAVLIVGALVYGIDHIEGINPQFKNIARVILIVALVIVAVIVLINLAASFLGHGPLVNLPRR